MIFRKILILEVRYLFRNTVILKKLKDKFANPRNAASGSLRQKIQMIQKKYL